MKEAYARAGYPLDTIELPDYLPLVLEFASEVPEEGLSMLVESRAAVEVIRRSLRHDGSPYAHLIESLIYFVPELDEEAVAEMQKLIVQGPPQERVGLEPYAADAAPGGRLGNAVFEGRKR
jgi:nitrate reductase delta subunit